MSQQDHELAGKIVQVLGRGGAATDVAAALGRIDIMIMPESP